MIKGVFRHFRGSFKEDSSVKIKLFSHFWPLIAVRIISVWIARSSSVILTSELSRHQRLPLENIYCWDDCVWVWFLDCVWVGHEIPGVAVVPWALRRESVRHRGGRGRSDDILHQYGSQLLSFQQDVWFSAQRTAITTSSHAQVMCVCVCVMRSNHSSPEPIRFTQTQTTLHIEVLKVQF